MVQQQLPRRAVVAFLMMLVAACAWGAAAAHAATSVVVQESEGVATDGRATGIGALELVAHRYASASDTTGTLSLAAYSSDGSRQNWNSVTVFDLDRDGIADAEVLVSPVGTGGAQATATAYTLPAARTFTDGDGKRCVNVNPAGLSGTTPVTNTIDLVGGQLTFGATFTWPAALQALARYAPRMVTAALQPGYYTRSNDEVPNRAGAGAVGYMSTSCGRDTQGNPTGVQLDPAQGTDRGFGAAAPTTAQDMPDPADGGGADLRGARIEQWAATNPTDDVTQSIFSAKATKQFHPTDVVLDLPADGEFTATGWFGAETAQSAPIGMIEVHRAPGASVATVDLWRTAVAPTVTGSGSTQTWCLPNALGQSGTDALEIQLPLTTAADGTKQLRLVADSLLGEQVYSAGSSDRSPFRWAFAAWDLTTRDGVPDTVDAARLNEVGDGPHVCSYAGSNDGTQISSIKFPLFKPGSPVLSAALSVDNDHPDRGAPVVLSATPDPQLSYMWDLADHRLQPLESASSKTARFDASYPARVAVRTTDGAVAILQHQISVANRPPAAAITVNGSAPAGEYGLGGGGTTLVFGGASSTDPDGTPIAAYDWTLTPDGGGAAVTGTGPAFTYTFTAEKSYTLTLRVTDPDGASNTTTISFRISGAVAPPVDVSRKPVVMISGPASAELGVDGTATATFDATGSHGTNGGDEALHYEWDLDGDGRYETDTGSVPRATARFTTRGARTVTVMGIDRYGNAATAAQEVAVRSYLDRDCPSGALMRTVSYGPARATACFLRVERPTAGPLWIASGLVNLNGLILTGAKGSTAVSHDFPDCDADACKNAAAIFNDPRRGVALALDPYDGHLVSNAPIAITASGTEVNLPLSLSPIDVTLPYSPRDDGFLVRVPNNSGLFGFPLTGEAEVRFPADGETDVRVTADGSGLLSGIGGDVHLHAYKDRGVVLDHLRLGFDNGLIKKVLRVKTLQLEYDRASQLWAGTADIVIPAERPLTVGASASVLNGRFKSVAASVSGINQHLGKGIFLQAIRFGVSVDPLDLSGGITLSAGPALKVKGLNRTALSVDGDFRLTFPSQSAPYTLFSLDATLNLLDQIRLAHTTLRFTDTGFTELRSQIGGDYVIAYFQAVVDGWFTADAFNLSGDADVGLIVGGRHVELVGGHAVVSTRGVAACGEIPVINLGGGVGYRWGEDVATFTGCDLSSYAEARPADAPAALTARAGAGGARAAAASAPSFDVPAGAPSVALKVAGAGGAPDVRVVDASGRTVLQTTQADELTATHLVLHDAKDALTTIVLKAPAAGRYAIETAPGSAAGVASAQQAIGRPAPRVRATLGARSLSWTVTPALAAGERVTFSERGADGSRTLFTTTAASGRHAFARPAGHGVRTISAQVATASAAAAPVAVAHYTAPRLVLPGAPRAVVATRGRRTVRVSFAAPRRGGPVASYRVTLRAAGRTVAHVVTQPRAVTFGGVGTAQAATVTVQALATANLGGGEARATLRAGAARSGLSRDAIRPRALHVTRSGSTVTITWQAGREQAKSYRLRVRIGRKTYRLTASPLHRTARIKKAPRGTVHVTITPLRLGGGAGPSLSR